MARRPILEQCCYCFDLRTGSLIVGCMQLAIAVLGLLDGIKYFFVESPTEASILVSEDSNNKYVKAFLDSGEVLHFTQVFVLLTIASLLVHGIRKQKRMFFIPWLGVHFMALIVHAVLTLVIPFSITWEGGSNLAAESMFLLAVLIVTFITHFYVVLVVFSHYQEVMQKKMESALNSYNAEHFGVTTIVTASECPPPAYDQLSFSSVDEEKKKPMENV